MRGGVSEGDREGDRVESTVPGILKMRKRGNLRGRDREREGCTVAQSASGMPNNPQG